MNVPLLKPPQQPPPREARLTLKSITRGRRKNPRRIIVFGVEGIGKTTFAANAPNPILLGAEDGSDQLDVPRFPSPKSFEDTLDAVKSLTEGEHDYQSLVIDTVDWLEPLIWEHCCRRDKEESIESYGYGKGYTTALDEWRRLLRALQGLRAEKGMEVIFLAHSWMKTFKNPEGEDFDRYELKLNAKAGGLLKEWCDAVLFANYETYAKKDERTKRVRGVATGSRLLFTERTAAYDAKNRYGLPSSISLDYAEFSRACDAGEPADVDALISEIKRKAGELGGELEQQTLTSLTRIGRDAVKLSQTNTWCNAKLAAKAVKEN